MTNETYQLELYKEELETLLWILDGNYDLPYDPEEREIMEIDIHLIYSNILKLLG
jgi:hypothetical protein